MTYDDHDDLSPQKFSLLKINRLYIGGMDWLSFDEEIFDYIMLNAAHNFPQSEETIRLADFTINDEYLFQDEENLYKKLRNESMLIDNNFKQCTSSSESKHADLISSKNCSLGKIL
jgi:hypothetical protein